MKNNYIEQAKFQWRARKHPKLYDWKYQWPKPTWFHKHFAYELWHRYHAVRSR